MNPTILSRSVAAGAMTGIRSMSGLAALTWPRGGPLAGIFAALALGEMVVDKMPGIGDRTDPLPLMGRIVIGACAGGYIARRDPGGVVAGAILGATSAFITAHMATRTRKELDIPTGASGLLEDSLVVALGSLVTANDSNRRSRLV